MEGEEGRRLEEGKGRRGNGKRGEGGSGKRKGKGEGREARRPYELSTWGLTGFFARLSKLGKRKR